MNHPIYKRALKVNMTKLFLDYIQSRVVDFRQNAIISIFGETGTGKSYVGWRIGEYIEHIVQKYLGIYVPFTDSNVHLDLAEQLSYLKNAKICDTHMLDEQTDFYGTASVYVISTMQNIEMTARKKQVNLIFCSPCVRTHYHNYVLETFLVKWPKQRVTVNDEGYIPLGKTYCFVYSAESKNYLDPLGYITVSHPEKLQQLKNYEKKKDEYIEKVLKGEPISIEEMRQGYINDFFNHPIYKSNPDIFRFKNKIIILLNKIMPGGAPNTFKKEIADEIKLLIETNSTSL